MDCDSREAEAFLKPRNDEDYFAERKDCEHSRFCQCCRIARICFIRRKLSSTQDCRPCSCQRHVRRKGVLLTSPSMAATIAMLGLLVVTGSSMADQPGFCTGKAIGYYADLTTACQDFLVCDGTSHHKFKCPGGTIFDERHQICDWKTKVVCPASQSIPKPPRHHQEEPVSFQKRFPNNFLEQKIPHQDRSPFNKEALRGFNENRLFSQRFGLLPTEEPSAEAEEEVPNRLSFSEPTIRTHKVFTKKLENHPGNGAIAVQKDLPNFEGHQQNPAFQNQLQFTTKDSFPHHPQNQHRRQPLGSHRQRQNINPQQDRTLINPLHHFGVHLKNRGSVKTHQEGTFAESNGLKVKEGPRKVLIFGPQPHEGNPFVPTVDHVLRIPAQHPSANTHQTNRRADRIGQHNRNLISPGFRQLQREAENRIMDDTAKRNNNHQFPFKNQRKNKPNLESSDYEDGFRFESGFEPIIPQDPNSPPPETQFEDFENFQNGRSLKSRPKVIKRPAGLEDHVILDMNRFIPPELQSFELSDARDGPPPSLLISRSGQQQSRTFAHQLSHRQEDVSLPFTGSLENELGSEQLFPAGSTRVASVKSETKLSKTNRDSTGILLKRRREKRNVEDGFDSKNATSTRGDRPFPSRITNKAVVSGKGDDKNVSKPNGIEEASKDEADSKNSGTLLQAVINRRSNLLEKNRQKKTKQRLKDYLEKKLRETLPHGNSDAEMPTEKEQPELINDKILKLAAFKSRLANPDKNNDTSGSDNKAPSNTTEDLKQSGSTVQKSSSSSGATRIDPVSKLLQYQKQREEKEAGKAKVAQTILSRRLEEAKKLASDEDNSLDGNERSEQEEAEDRSDDDDQIITPTALPLTIRNHGSREGNAVSDNRFKSRQLEIDQSVLQPPPIFPQPPPMLFPFISPSLLPFLTPPLTDKQREAILSRRTRNFEVSFNQNRPSGSSNQQSGHDLAHQHEQNSDEGTAAGVNEHEDNNTGLDHFHQDNEFQAADQADSTAPGHQHQPSEEFQPALTTNHNDVRRDDRFVQNDYDDITNEIDADPLDDDQLIVEPHSQPNRRATGEDFFVNGPKMMFRVKVIPHVFDDEGENDEDSFFPEDKLQSHHPALQQLSQQQQALLSASLQRKKKRAKKNNNLTRGSTSRRPHDNLFNHKPAENFDDSFGLLDSSPGQQEHEPEEDPLKDVNQEVDQFIGSTGQGGPGHHNSQQDSGLNGGRRPSFFLNALTNFNNANFRPGLGNLRPSRLHPAANLRPGNPQLQQLAFDHKEKLSNIGFSGSGGKNQLAHDKPSHGKPSGSKKGGSHQSHNGDFGTNDFSSFGASPGIPGAGQDFHNPNGAFTPGVLNQPTSFGNINGNLFGPPRQGLFGQSKILNGLLNGLQSLGVGGSPHHSHISPSSGGFSDNDPDFIFRRAHHHPGAGKPGNGLPGRLNHQRGLVISPHRVPVRRPPVGVPRHLLTNAMSNLIGGRNLRRPHLHKIQGQHPAFFSPGIRRMSLQELLPVPVSALRPPPLPPGVHPPHPSQSIEQALDSLATSSLLNEVPSGGSEEEEDGVPPGGDALHFHIHTVEKNEGAPPSSEGHIVSEAIKPTRFGGEHHEGVDEEDTGNSIEESDFDGPEEANSRDSSLSALGVAPNRNLLSPFTLFRQHTEQPDFAKRRLSRANTSEKSLNTDLAEKDEENDPTDELDDEEENSPETKPESTERESRQESEQDPNNKENEMKLEKSAEQEAADKEVSKDAEKDPAKSEDDEESNEVSAPPTLFREFIRGKSLTGLRELPKALHALLKSSKASSS